MLRRHMTDIVLGLLLNKTRGNILWFTSTSPFDMSRETCQ